MGPEGDDPTSGMTFHLAPVGAIKDPSKPTVKELNEMASFNGGYVNVTSSASASKSGATVLVDDLLTVFPYLAEPDENPYDFAQLVKQAATLARQEDALVGLRDRFHQAAHDELEHSEYTGPRLVEDKDPDDAA